MPAYKLSVNDMVIKAMALALRDVPDANVSWTETAMVQHKHADVGVAVSIPGGLITPIIRSADEKTLSVISNEMKDLAARARNRKLKPEEYQGGTTAVSNLGMFGIKDFAAVINPPHATILAVGAGEERAVVKNGEIKIANDHVGDAVDRPSRRRRRARRRTARRLQALHRKPDGHAGLSACTILNRRVQGCSACADRHEDRALLRRLADLGLRCRRSRRAMPTRTAGRACCRRRSATASASSPRG